MVRRSSATSRGITYWFLIFSSFFFFSLCPRYFVYAFASFPNYNPEIIRKNWSKGNQGNNKLDARVYAAFPISPFPSKEFPIDE